MRTWWRLATGAFAASLLLAVPASALALLSGGKVSALAVGGGVSARQTTGQFGVPVTRRELNKHQRDERRLVNQYDRNLLRRLREHERLERQLGVVGPPNQPATRRQIAAHQRLERREVNQFIRRVAAQLRAHQLIERRLLQATPFRILPPFPSFLGIV